MGAAPAGLPPETMSAVGAKNLPKHLRATYPRLTPADLSCGQLKGNIVGQNTSSAVMQQRSKELDSLDDFPTPPWGTRALLEFLTARQLIGEAMTAREPAANRGFLARVLAEVFADVLASDIADYGAGYAVDDFLFPGDLLSVDWTITNPPFKLAEEFINRALKTSRRGVAMLVRSAFLEGGDRYDGIFKDNPPHMVLQFTERLVMHQGKLVNPNIPVPYLDPKTGETKMRKPSSATAYCWVIWLSDRPAAAYSQLHWTGKCRVRLERPGDYLASGGIVGALSKPLPLVGEHAAHAPLFILPN